MSKSEDQVKHGVQEVLVLAEWIVELKQADAVLSNGDADRMMW